MTKNCRRIFIATILILLSFESNSPSSGWKTVRDRYGIVVRIRSVENSDIDEFLADMTFNTSMSSLLALLDDTASYTEWHFNCSKATLLYKKNNYERIIYMVTTSSWPVSDRDIAIQSILSQSKESGVINIELEGLPDYIPPEEGVVRVSSLRGFWRLEPQGKGRVKVVYSLHSEPGGSVPGSIVNSMLVEIPYNTMFNMRRMVGRAPYRNAHYSSIREKQ